VGKKLTFFGFGVRAGQNGRQYDPGGAHGHDELPVEPGIARCDGPVAPFGVAPHASRGGFMFSILPPGRRLDWRKSDTAIRAEKPGNKRTANLAP
jgi:hypothetical protein